MALKKAISLRRQAFVHNCREFQCPNHPESAKDQGEMAALQSRCLKLQRVLSEGPNSLVSGLLSPITEMMAVSHFVGVRFVWFGVRQ